MRRFMPVLLVACLLLPACQREQDAPLAKAEPEFKGKAAVEVAAVIRGPVFKTYRAVGTVAPIDFVRVIPKVSGRVANVLVDEGDRVAKDMVLMKLDPFDYEQAFDNAVALKRQAEAGFEKSRRDYENMTGLYYKKSDSQQNYQDALTAFNLARYQYDQAEAGVRIARQNLAECQIRTPIKGIVTHKIPNQGELVGQDIAFVIEDMDIIKVEIDLPEEAYSLISCGNPAKVTADATGGEAFEGSVTRINPTVDPLSRTFKVTVTVRNPDLKLRTGMTARTSLVLKAREKTLNIPAAGLLKSDQGFFVYVAENGTARKVAVKTGIQTESVTEITSGLAENDLIVVKGHTGLKDGLELEIKETEQTD